MSYFSTLGVIGGVYMIAAISPGPNFLIVSQLSLAGQRRRACLVAAGIATGSVLWASFAMAGLAALLMHVGWLALGLKLVGAAYLVWLGAKLLRGAAAKPSEEQAESSSIAQRPGSAYRMGLTTCLTNPKSGVFWTSVFATTLPVGAPAWVYVATAAMIAVLSAGWHIGVALAFNTGAIQSAYRRLQRPIDAACGAILVALGVGLAAY